MEKSIDLLKSGCRYLSAEGLASSLVEAEVFLTNILDCSRFELYFDSPPIKESAAQYFWHLLNLRSQGYPLQYLLGSTEFMGLEFKLRPGVFIPRPETEILVETAINFLTNKRTNEQTNKRILELGTGCGNIAVSLAKSLQKADIFACDICDFALKLAQQNRKLNKADICLVKSDLFSAFRKENSFSLIISNPPYIKAAEIAGLPREVHYEPRLALEAGAEGLSFYRRIIDQAPAYLAAQGLLMLELGDQQAAAVKEMLAQSREYTNISLVKDYNGVQRVIIARYG